MYVSLSRYYRLPHEYVGATTSEDFGRVDYSKDIYENSPLFFADISRMDTESESESDSENDESKKI